MRQKILALAALIAAAGAGTVWFVNFEDAHVERGFINIGAWEVIDMDSVTMRACNTQQCTAAQNILEDAGSSCIPRFAAADFRIGQRLRNLATDAGVTLGSQKYQRIELIAMRCPGVDGGFAFGVPMTDAGWPIYAVAVTPPRCVRAPTDGGSCLRRLPDAGAVFFGVGNVMPVDAGVGAQCEPCGCGVMFGDNPAVDL